VAGNALGSLNAQNISDAVTNNRGTGPLADQTVTRYNAASGGIAAGCGVVAIGESGG
jgi:hypothetical protein